MYGHIYIHIIETPNPKGNMNIDNYKILVIIIAKMYPYLL